MPRWRRGSGRTVWCSSGRASRPMTDSRSTGRFRLSRRALGAGAAAILPLALGGRLLAAARAAEGVSADPLRAGFLDPPHSARPYVWWHWMSGNVSRGGAELDLAWMKRVGVGGVQIFSGGNLLEPLVVDEPRTFMSPGWKDAFRRSAEIARETGMDLMVASSSGWSLTGGTWVEPRDAMKKYVWSETRVAGAAPSGHALPSPPTASGPFQGVKASYPHARPLQLEEDLYHDTIVLAFPTPAPEVAPARPAFAAREGVLDLSPLVSGDCSTEIALAIAPGETSAWIEARFDRPTAISAVTLALGTRAGIEIEVVGDAGEARPIARFEAELPDACPQQTYAFAPMTGTRFRIVLTLPVERVLPDLPPNLPGSLEHFAQDRPRAFRILNLALHQGGRVNRFEAKAGFQATADFEGTATPDMPPEFAVPASSVRDVTPWLRRDGSLGWAPPPGNWTILRFGWSLTGRANQPAEDEATGLEVDKLDADAVRAYVAAYLDLFADAAGRPSRHPVQGLVTDSWEAGVQNWSRGLLDAFAVRRGYDPLPYLPVLAGHIVDSPDASDRFLWDFRQTLKDLLVENHYGTIANELRRRGMTYFSEATGDTPRAIADGLAIKARADVPTGEFWFRPFGAGPGQPPLKADLHEAASAANLYGKAQVAAEAFTVAAGTDPWAFSPAMLKPVADEIFARGANRILIHESHHQPLADAKPGLMLGFFGQFFNRNDTWAEEAGPWLTYLACTSHMLQQGRAVADIAYFYGEERNLTELHQRDFDPGVLPGYQFDFVNAEALRTLFSVDDHRLLTPSGMRYRLLYLSPAVKRLTVATLAKIAELVAAGAVLVGQRPAGGLGRASADTEIRRLADRLWGPPAERADSRPFGQGRVYATSLAAALDSENVGPAVSGSDDLGRSLLTQHRASADQEIFFLSNQADRSWSGHLDFRVRGKRPEIWRAADGSLEQASYETVPNGVRVPLRLEAHEAVFIIFREPASAMRWTAPGRAETLLAQLEGPWPIRFGFAGEADRLRTFDRLISWPDSTDPVIRYHSGEATYARSIEVPSAWLGMRDIVLDLGEVHALAVVSINGKRIATSWHPPHRVAIGAALKPGVNHLEIKVINLWPNRLIGDAQPGARKTSFAPQSTYAADSPLRPSGLLGPVRLIGVEDA